MKENTSKPTTKERLSKLMAAQGLCSRREADNFIQQGWVQVDDQTIDTLGTKIYSHQKITLHPWAQQQLQNKVTILLNKPLGYVSAQPEKGYQPAVKLIIPDTQFCIPTPDFAFSPSHIQHLAPAGRLDIDSTGLLV
jgi:23S rRNA pseudouridine2604 synthase